MYTIKAAKGEVKVNFDLKSIIDNANKTANIRIENNAKIRHLHKELATDYLLNLNKNLHEIGVKERFKISNIDNQFANCIQLYFGHGRCNVTISFNIDVKDDYCNPSIIGKIEVFKSINESYNTEKCELKSIGDTINKMEDAIKFFIINENVKDYKERKKLEKELFKQ